MENLSLVMFLMASFVLSGLMAMAAWILSEKSPDKEKLSPYECGFDPFGQPGHPISVKFFLMAILFLMFDLEVTLLMPWGLSWGTSTWISYVIALVFLSMLVWGLMYEWLAGGLEWE